MPGVSAFSRTRVLPRHRGFTTALVVPEPSVRVQRWRLVTALLFGAALLATFVH